MFIEPTGEVVDALFKNDRVEKKLNFKRSEIAVMLVAGMKRKIASDENAKKIAPIDSKDSNNKMNQTTKSIKNQSANGKEAKNADLMRKSTADMGLKRKETVLKNSVDNDESDLLDPFSLEQYDRPEMKEFKQRNEFLNPANPYTRLLQFDDLFAGYTEQKQKEITEYMQIIGLRYNEVLNKIYRTYKAQYEDELSFTLKMKVFWIFLREVRLLTPKISLAEINRMYYKNPRNDFRPSFDYEGVSKRQTEMKVKYFGKNPRKMEVLKAFDVSLRNAELQYELPRIEYKSLEEDPEQSSFYESIKKIDAYIESMPEKEEFHERNKYQSNEYDKYSSNVHCESTDLLFRHFVDILVRVAYIKEGFKIDKIGIAFEGLVMCNIIPILILQNIDALNEFQDEELKIVNYIEKKLSDELVQKLFDENCIFNNIGIKNHEDKTSNLRMVIDLLTKADLISNDTMEDKELLLQILERYFNTYDGVSFTYTSLKKKWQQRKVQMEQNLQPTKNKFNLGSDDGEFVSGSELSQDISGGEEDESDQYYTEEKDEYDESEEITEKTETKQQSELNVNKSKTSMHKKEKPTMTDLSDNNQDEPNAKSKQKILEEKYERDMVKADYELSKAAQNTMGYEMIQREWIELISLYFMNKFNLRQLSEERLEKVLDENFALQAKTGSRRQRITSIPYMFDEATLPVYPKDQGKIDKEKTDKYWDYDRYLCEYEDKVKEEENKLKAEFDYNVINIIEANDLRAKKIEEERKRQEAKDEKEKIRQQKEEKNRLLAAEKKQNVRSKSPMPGDDLVQKSPKGE